MTEAKYKAPHVHEALGAILSDLSVEKNGQLPANMGGKPYISAVDLSLEIKRKFVDHDLILIPSERVIKHEAILGQNQKITYVISVEGEYTILSRRDGSTVTVGAVGDGVAMGSAVAANISSTNALKNALLRTFLVTEQSVEDEAKNGPKESSAPAQTTTAGPSKNLRALQDDLRKRSQAAAPGGKGKPFIEGILAEHPDKFADEKGEILAFDKVWQSEPHMLILDGLIAK